MTPPATPAADLFSQRLTSLDYDEVSDAVNRHLCGEGAHGPLLMDATNTMGMAASCQDERLKSSLHAYDYLLPDGMPLVWAMRRRRIPVRQATAGPHVVETVLGRLEQPTSIALVGGFPEEHARIAEAARTRFPNATFALMYDAPPGVIDDAYVAEVVRLIEESGSRLVFVCLGVPRQYYLAASARPLLGDRVMLSVGGAFRYMIGDARIPPRWVQQSGLWWLHRLLSEPRRLAGRYARYNALFLYYYLRFELTKPTAASGPGLT